MPIIFHELSYSAKPTLHAAASLRPPRHRTNMLTPIGLGVLAFWRDGTAELARELRAVDTLEPPVTQERRGGANSAADSRADRVTGNACVS